MECPFDLPVTAEYSEMSDAHIVIDPHDRVVAYHCNNESSAYIVHVINSHEKLVSELRASDNWLHRLLKSCVILLDDGEVTKRAVEKQSRYNQQALKGESQ